MKKLLMILFFAPIFLQAQTRFYLTQVASSLSPAVNAAWNVTTGNAIWNMSRFSDRNTNITIASGNTGAAAVRKILIRQFVSFPLATQTLNGTLTGQIRFSISSVASRSGEGFCYFRIINKDGTVATEVGTLTTSALVTGTATNRTLIALTLSSVSVTTGQRFCIDVGWNYSTGSNTTTTSSISIISTNANWLPVDNTTTTVNNPWFEFSQTILFQNSDKGFF